MENNTLESNHRVPSTVWRTYGNNTGILVEVAEIGARVIAGKRITGYEYRLIEASSTRREVMRMGMDPAEASWHPLGEYPA